MKTENLHRHVCYISGKGMSQGFLMNHETYDRQEDFIFELRKLIPDFNADINIGISDGYFGGGALADNLIPITISDEDLINHSYEEDNHLWTEWHQEDLEEDGEGYDDYGCLYIFDSELKIWNKAKTLTIL